MPLRNTAIITILDDEISACGEPAFNASTESGVFVWKDCSTDNSWHVRTVAGGASTYINYSGMLIADQNITGVSSIGPNNTHVINGNDSPELSYQLLIPVGGIGGFDFNDPAASNVCLYIDAPSNAPIYIGASRNTVTLPLHLGSLTNCGGQSLTINDVVLSETDTAAEFTVRLLGPSDDTVTVEYSTDSASATGGDDFSESLNTVLTFLPGEITKTITVPIIQDALAEGSEIFSVILNNSGNVLIKDAIGEAIIIDDEITDYGSVDCAAIDKTVSHVFSSNQPTFTYSGKVRDPHIAHQSSGGNPYTHGLSLYIPDGISASVPGLVTLIDQPMIKCGYVDVTQPPFNADSSGQITSAVDNVTAINATMDFARQHMLATYFPPGIYIVNDMLECVQGVSKQNSTGFGAREDPYGACLITGSNTGAERPKMHSA